MSASNNFFGRTLCAAIALFLMIGLIPMAWAAEAAGADAMEWYVDQDAVTVYVRHSGEDQTAQARVGTQSAGEAVITGTDGGIPIVTWLLVDNSLSISRADQVKIKQLLTDLVAGRTPEERFNLCTFSTSLNILLQDSQSYADLKGQIDGIQHSNQYAFLVDALSGILDIEDSREGREYVRIVVISDGVDINPEGLTKDELTMRLQDRNVPIYTLGCEQAGNEQALKEMYSLSRLTHARSWSLSDLESTLTVSDQMSGAEVPVCARVNLPEAVRDGAPRGVQITFGDGAVAELTTVMPFGELTPEKSTPEPTPSLEPTPAPTPVLTPEPEVEDNSLPVLKLLPWIALALLVVIATAVVVIILLRREKEKKRFKPVPEGELSSDMMTDILDQEDDDGGTLVLVNNDRHLMLSLTDRSNPSRHYEVPLRDRVSIGRSSSNHIVLDYERSVSGTHCEIYLDGTVFRIKDLNSRNGTFVDGIRVADVAEISNGSTIRLGRLELLVEIR